MKNYEKELVKEYIIELLLNGEEWRRKDIVEVIQERVCSMSESTIISALKELVEEKKIIKTDYGRYQLPNIFSPFKIFCLWEEEEEEEGYQED